MRLMMDFFALIGVVGLAVAFGSTTVVPEPAVEPRPFPTPSNSEECSDALVEYGELYGLSTLCRTAYGAGEFEIRVWVGPSNFVRRGVTFSNRLGTQKAIHMTGEVNVTNNSARTEELPFLHKERIADFGGNFGLAKLLKGTYPSDLKWRDPDDNSVVIEVRYEKSYKVIRYSTSTVSRPGRKVMEYVRAIEQLYQLKLIN